ncbi:MAG: hypothetical protein ACYCZJ_13300 [Sulfuriferula sp.]
MSELESALALQIRAIKLPEPEREFKFHPTRRFRFDFCWPQKMFAVECDGAHWVNGRHSRGKGVDSDCEKYALAMLDGWRILKVTSTHIKSGQAIQWIEGLLGGN